MVTEYPMMAVRRVVVLRFFDNVEKDVKKKIAEALKDVPETTLVIIEGDKIALTPKPPSRFILEETFKPIYYSGLPSWIQKRFAKRGKRASDGAVEILQNNIGEALRELDGEIEKIVMVAGDASTVTEEHTEKIVGEFRRYTVYALQNAVGIGNFAEAVHILRALSEEEKNRETYFTLILASHIMKIAEYNSLVRSGVSRSEAIKALKENEYGRWKYNKMNEQVRNFGESEVRRALTVLADTDSDLKRSGIGKELIMELMLPRIMP
jgi:DNA polymerase III delta subunit